MSYGDTASVQAFVRHMTFDQPNNPTTAQITQFLVWASNKLDGWLAASGYQIPVTNPPAPAAAVSILDSYAVMGAAGMAELTQRSGGYDPNKQNARENKFLTEFYCAEAYIKSGALSNIGVPEVRAPSGLFGLSVGGRTVGGQALTPIFGRSSFANDPTKESPTPEPDHV